MSLYLKRITKFLELFHFFSGVNIRYMYTSIIVNSAFFFFKLSIITSIELNTICIYSVYAN